MDARGVQRAADGGKTKVVSASGEARSTHFSGSEPCVVAVGLQQALRICTLKEPWVGLLFS